MPKKVNCSSMCGHACALFILVASQASAEIDSEHQRLMDMTVTKIVEEYAELSLNDSTSSGHVAIRCSLISSTMVEVMAATAPSDLPEQSRIEFTRIKDTYAESSIAFLEIAYGFLNLPEDQFIELQTAMVDDWSKALAQAAVVLFRNYPEDSEEYRIGKSFKDDLDICNHLLRKARGSDE